MSKQNILFNLIFLIGVGVFIGFGIAFYTAKMIEHVLFSVLAAWCCLNSMWGKDES